NRMSTTLPLMAITLPSCVAIAFMTILFLKEYLGGARHYSYDPCHQEDQHALGAGSGVRQSRAAGDP
ncbi:MAG: hypothetical protein KDC57_18155, partial [Saprospiraceae bacterium]|nr:hypothetical protein [Saprospiraceae bacterium]